MKTSLFLVFYILWLCFFSLIGLISYFVLFWKKDHESIDVTQFDTICKVLNDKNILSDEDYLFETTFVASSYSAETFMGYKLIVTPWVYFLKRHTSLDRFTLYLVCKWIAFQKRRLDQVRQFSFFSGLASTATLIACGVGKLSFLTNGVLNE